MQTNKYIHIYRYIYGYRKIIPSILQSLQIKLINKYTYKFKKWLKIRAFKKKLKIYLTGALEEIFFIRLNKEK